MRGWLVTISLLAVGCSQSGRPCGNKFMLLWPSNAGGYALTVVDTSLNDSKKLAGPFTRVFYEAPIQGRQFSGPVAEPHVTNAGDVCVPTDAGSAVAVSAFEQFNRLHDFDQRLGVADQLSWPRQIGVETRLNGAPGDVENNAHYVGDKDLVVLVPTSMPGVPAAMNHGVLAHEHFHAHFQSQVLNGLVVTPPPMVLAEGVFAVLGPLLPGFGVSASRTYRVANDYILRGWNEGLADFYAAVYLNKPEFLSDTFGPAPVVAARALDGTPLYLKNDWIGPLVRQMESSTGAAREQARDTLGRNAYAQGSSLARALWTVVHGDAAVAPALTLAKMMKSLGRLPARINDKVFASELDNGIVLSTLLEDVPLSPRACLHLRAVLDSSAAYGRINACAPF